MTLPFEPVVLRTDALIYLLLAGLLVLGRYIRRREHLHPPWRRLARSRPAMISLVVLSAYAAIGLLDSLHYRPLLNHVNGASAPVYSARVLSVFDALVTPLRRRVETTYSAPFAAYSYAKVTRHLPGGQTVRMFPRLKYGGAFLKHPAAEAWPDIMATTARALIPAIWLWAGLAAAIAAGLARRERRRFIAVGREIWRNQRAVPWRAILLTVGVLLLFAFPAAALSVKYHILGTDKVGQDVFYLALKSIRTGLVIGTLTTMVMLPLALLLGITAGYFRGWVDDAIQYLYTTLNSIPGVLLIVAAVLMMQVYMGKNPALFDTVAVRADMRLLFLCIILGMTSWTGLCRLLRGETLKLREMEYIQAAEAFGVHRWRILTRHILPNVMHIVLITVVMDFSGLVLAEAVLSYVGVGVDPSMQSWGNMINSARLEMAREPMVWWQLAAAFLFMFGLVLPANLFADALRDAFDPRIGPQR